MGANVGGALAGSRRRRGAEAPGVVGGSLFRGAHISAAAVVHLSLVVVVVAVVVVLFIHGKGR